jgi:L-amino acid N-acyltransferase YncA
MNHLAVRDANAGDAAAIAAIYNAYVRDSVATFELEPVAEATMQSRIDAVQSRGLPWLAIERDGAMLGYAYATPWKARAAYARTVETSIYLVPDATGRGLGRSLYAQLIERLRGTGMHALIGGISLPNAASVALHEALGFACIGRFREVGFKHGRWVDVGYWQRLLEQSAATG